MAEEIDIKPSTVSVNNRTENISDWSVSTMIHSLKSTFRPCDFSKVEAELLAREKKLKLEIETLREEKRSFSGKLEEERLEKMGISDELRKCKNEVDEMRSEVSKLKVENFVLRGKEKSAEERLKRLSEEVKSMREKDHEIIDLKGKNCELECAKAKAESEMEMLRVRFKELDERVSNLESGLTMLGEEDGSKNQNGIGNSENGRSKPADTMNVEEISIVPSCVSPRKANGHSPNAGKGGLPSQNAVEIVNLDSDDDSAPEENPSEKRMTSPTKNSHSAQICVGNGSPTLKRKQTSSIDACESENGDNDDTKLSGKLKMRKFQESVCRPDDCPLNQWSTTKILSDINGVNRSTQRENFKVSGQREQRTDTEQNSQDLMSGGFPMAGLSFCSEDSSVSSDSESDDDSYGVHISFNHSQPGPAAQR
ncbi:hypothetical protein HRI_004671200 [Hibiscus trionum]|uniref:Uncharacterized protein n=1 Tax=Hibiscus trionum TaxID=183268 RepID=A0A9W7J9Z2_HIBTR|nr:hypothetical protein HRI_004671200 [Hibiscus trionum]